MHHYAFHIKDYGYATAHLSNEQDLAYRRLLDLAYESEKPLPSDLELIARRARCSETDVRIVLEEFWTFSSDGWRHSRVDEEVSAYRQRAAQSRANGKRGGRPKKPDGILAGSGSEPDGKATKNHKPGTKNQEPGGGRPGGTSPCSQNQDAGPSSTVQADPVMAGRIRSLAAATARRTQ